ncbi:MAG: MFS transporter [Oceanospirillales bacterium]|nr:MAG: MFS transporter [Oceanospirillales bacterium]
MDSLAPKIHFALIFLAHALGAMCVLGVLASGPQLIAQLDLTAIKVGALASAYSATLAIASLPAGMVVDRLGTRPALTLSALVMCCGMLWVALSSSFTSLCIGMAISGAGYGLINPAAGRAILLWFSPQWRGTLMGLKQTGVPVGGAIGTALAGLGIVYGWQIGVMGVALVAGLLAVLFFFLLPKKDTAGSNQHSPNITRGLPKVLSTPQLGRANLAAGLTNGGQFTLWAFLAETLRQSAALSASLIALCMGLLQLGTLLGRLFWGLTNDRFLSQNAALTLRWLCITGIAGAFILLLLGHTEMWLLAPIAALLLGFSMCSATGIHVALTISLAPTHFTGTAIGYTMLVTNLGGVIMPLIFGALLDYAGAGSFAIGLIVMMGIAFWLLLLNAETQSNKN